MLAGSIVAQTEQVSVDVISGVGYQSDVLGPHLLMGGSMSTGDDAYRLTVRMSNVVVPSQGTTTVSAGIEGTWERFRPPLYVWQVQSKAVFEQRGEERSRILSLTGEGSVGGVKGNLTVGYVEQRFTAFPWDQQEPAEVVSSGEAYFHLSGGLSALVARSWGLRWSQDLAFQKNVLDPFAAFSVATGPELSIGRGSLATQAGVVLSTEAIAPLARLRYELRSPDFRSLFRITVENVSLEEDRPSISGSYALDGTDLRVQTLLEVASGGAPTIYFSIHPKF